MHKHGHYVRSMLLFGVEYPIQVQRFYCPDCKLTSSELPAFLVPYSSIPVVVRNIVVELHAAGQSIRSLAKRFEFARSTVQCYVRSGLIHSHYLV